MEFEKCANMCRSSHILYLHVGCLVLLVPIIYITVQSMSHTIQLHNWANTVVTQEQL